MSGAFQNLCLVLKFSFKPPDGICLVQSCLEFLPVIMESYVGAECVQCCLWLHESQLPSSVRESSGPSITKKSPQTMTILAWYNRFIETYCVSQARVDLVLQMRPYKMCGRPSFAIHENQPHWTPVYTCRWQLNIYHIYHNIVSFLLSVLLHPGFV